MYKTLPTNRRSLPLKVSSSIFANAWKICVTNKQSDLTDILDMMKPVFAHWEKLLTRQAIEDDINFLTMCRMLDPDPQKALFKIKQWVMWAENTSSIEEELCLIFIERIRRIRYIPSLASDKMIEYVVSKDYKLGLHHHIRAINRLKMRDALYYSEQLEDDDFTIEVTFPDFFLIKKIQSNDWNSYLFHLISEGYSTIERSELTKLHRRNLYKEEQKICHLVKLKQ